MSLNRRQWLTAAAGAALVAPAVHGADKNGRKYTTALVGTGWWGRNILRVAIEAGRSDVVALCDVDSAQLEPALAEVEMLTGRLPKRYKDYRELLDREKPQIVICATPDHWHPLVTIDAVRCGAHVYVEKPISHTIHEGWAMVKAARAAERVVQVGTHRRASPHNIAAMEFIREGRLGKVGMVRAFVLYGGGPGKRVADAEPPASLDWNMWCGPAPLRPFNPAIHPKGFRRFLDYANGTLGDWGIHWMDQILWCLERKWPRKVASYGGRHVLADASDAPDTQLVIYELDDLHVTWEHRLYAGNGAENHNVGCYFYGTEGTLHLGWLDGWTFYPRSKGGKPLHQDPQLHLPDQQNIPELWADFLEAIDKGRRPICDIEYGHLSTNMSLLGMLAMKLGRSLTWDGRTEQVAGDPEANAMLRRAYREPWQYPEVDS